MCKIGDGKNPSLLGVCVIMVLVVEEQEKEQEGMQLTIQCALRGRDGRRVMNGFGATAVYVNLRWLWGLHAILLH